MIVVDADALDEMARSRGGRLVVFLWRAFGPTTGEQLVSAEMVLPASASTDPSPVVVSDDDVVYVRRCS